MARLLPTIIKPLQLGYPRSAVPCLWMCMGLQAMSTIQLPRYTRCQLFRCRRWINISRLSNLLRSTRHSRILLARPPCQWLKARNTSMILHRPMNTLSRQKSKETVYSLTISASSSLTLWRMISRSARWAFNRYCMSRRMMSWHQSNSNKHAYRTVKESSCHCQHPKKHSKIQNMLH